MMKICIALLPTNKYLMSIFLDSCFQHIILFYFCYYFSKVLNQHLMLELDVFVGEKNFVVEAHNSSNIYFLRSAAFSIIFCLIFSMIIPRF